jgi:hypothetical protein
MAGNLIVTDFLKQPGTLASLVYVTIDDYGAYVYEKFPTVNAGSIGGFSPILGIDNNYSKYGYISFIYLFGASLYLDKPQEINWAEQTFTPQFGNPDGVRCWIRPGVQGQASVLPIKSVWNVPIVP